MYRPRKNSWNDDGWDNWSSSKPAQTSGSTFAGFDDGEEEIDTGFGGKEGNTANGKKVESIGNNYSNGRFYW